jgi:hypothetical protein
MKLFLDAKQFQVVSCLWPVLGPIRHVDDSGQQTLTYVLRDVHDIKAMGHVEVFLVRQVLENRPGFLHTMRRLCPRTLLSRQRALFLVF